MSETNQYAIQITEGIGTSSTESHVQGPFESYEAAKKYAEDEWADLDREIVVCKLVPVETVTDAEWKAAMDASRAA